MSQAAIDDEEVIVPGSSGHGVANENRGSSQDATDDDTTLQCSACFRMFDKRQALSGHFNDQHRDRYNPDNPGFRCTIGNCRFSYGNLTALNNHVRNDHRPATANRGRGGAANRGRGAANTRSTKRENGDDHQMHGKKRKDN